jgi:hypothetical protein
MKGALEDKSMLNCYSYQHISGSSGKRLPKNGIVQCLLMWLAETLNKG